MRGNRLRDAKLVTRMGRQARPFRSAGSQPVGRDLRRARAQYTIWMRVNSSSSASGVSFRSRASRAMSACSASVCELTETYSPAAIDIAPATSPARPAIRISGRPDPAAATPTTRLAVRRDHRSPPEPPRAASQCDEPCGFRNATVCSGASFLQMWRSVFRMLRVSWPYRLPWFDPQCTKRVQNNGHVYQFLDKAPCTGVRYPRAAAIIPATERPIPAATLSSAIRRARWATSIPGNSRSR